MSMTQNEEAIAHNQQLIASVRRSETLANILFVLIILGLTVVLVVVSTGLSSSNSDLRADADSADVELRCRSEFVNAQAQAQADLAIEDARNDSITSLALARLSRGDDYSELTEQLEGSAARLEELSAVLASATKARTESVETCQEG